MELRFKGKWLLSFHLLAGRCAIQYEMNWPTNGLRWKTDEYRQWEKNERKTFLLCLFNEKKKALFATFNDISCHFRPAEYRGLLKVVPWMVSAGIDLVIQVADLFDYSYKKKEISLQTICWFSFFFFTLGISVPLRSRFYIWFDVECCKKKTVWLSDLRQTNNWLIDFKGISTCLGYFMPNDLAIVCIYQTPPYEQGMTQDQFFKQSLSSLNSGFFFS